MLDVTVIGAGHAGIEAGLAAARLGCQTLVLTLQLDWVGNMPCNPAIGGTAKGQIVREIDALGGAMGQVADANALQCRMLNATKGAAVQAPRAQVDRRCYAAAMKQRLENTPRLQLKQAEVVELVPQGDHWLLRTRTEQTLLSRTVVLATGTFLRGRIHIGGVHYSGGPDGMPPANALGLCLEQLGLPLRRFKTGTPPRVDFRTIDATQMTLQAGDPLAVPFSFGSDAPPRQSSVCYLTYTTPQTKDVILQNLHRSPLYSGQIAGVGPRYCPSIEDKMVRFPHKERHAVFLEPCGADSQEYYVQGMSSSLPEDVQLAFLRSLPGMDKCEPMRPAYAIEYDCVDPLALQPSLEFRALPGLFGAGQFNGSSGYEEAAAQGLLAGINAAHLVLQKPPVVLRRAESYIGTLIDDLVTLGCHEPYRMLTARSEFRLLLRHDTADRRLTPLGHALGLLSAGRYARFCHKQAQMEQELQRIQTTSIAPCPALAELFASLHMPPLDSPQSLESLLKRPELSYALLSPFDLTRPALSHEQELCLEADVKYAGYLRRQENQSRELARHEAVALPADLEYASLRGLRLEAREVLSRNRPATLAQAARNPGVTPADLEVLLLYLKAKA